MAEKTSHQECVRDWGLYATPGAQPVSVYEMFRKSALQHPHKPALIFLSKKISYQELDRLVQRFAAALSRRGVKKGDRIGTLLPDCPQYTIAFLALTRLGAIHVPINVMCKGNELRYILVDSGVRMVIALDLYCRNLTCVVLGTWVRDVIVTDIDDFLPLPTNALYRLKAHHDGMRPRIRYGGHVLRFVDLLKEKGGIPSAPADFHLDDSVMMVYSAGSSGRSKGVMLSHRDLAYSSRANSENLGPSGSEVDLGLFSRFQAGGCKLAPSAWSKAAHPGAWSLSLKAAVA